MKRATLLLLCGALCGGCAQTKAVDRVTKTDRPVIVCDADNCGKLPK